MTLPELEAIQRAKIGAIAGFAAVVDFTGNDALWDRPATKILSAFVGPYGEARASSSGPSDKFDWAAATPGPSEPLATWSTHEDPSGFCVVEGDFYAMAWRRRPRLGRDDTLARTVFVEMLRAGPSSINELSGLFSGVIFSSERKRLWFFVDQTGSRMLYYRVSGGRCEIASNVYGLAAGIQALRLDPVGVNEDLVFGAPLDHRMIFRDVHIVPPGTAIEFDGHDLVKRRYFSFPRRLAKLSSAGAAEMISGALEQSAAHLGLDPDQCSIGLSGGKDSRVAASAVTHAGLRPRAFTFRTRNDDGDAALGQRVAHSLKLPSSIFNIHHLPQAEEIVALSTDSAILSGGFTAAVGFLTFAAFVSHHSRVLFTGFAGDCLSGSWSGVEPWRARDVDDLSQMNLERIGFVVPPVVASSLLAPELRVPEYVLLENWRNGYRHEYQDLPDLTATHLSMRIGHRNRRWTGSFYHSMRAFSSPTQLFGARDVLEAYLSLPTSLLKNQRAHIRAAGARYPNLLQIPSWKSLGRIPLGWEPYADLPFKLRYALRLRRQRKPFRLPQGEPVDFNKLTFRTRRFVDAIRSTAILDQGYVRDAFVPHLRPPLTNWLHKLAAMLIHSEFAMDRRVLLPSYYLEPRLAA